MLDSIDKRTLLNDILGLANEAKDSFDQSEAWQGKLESGELEDNPTAKAFYYEDQEREALLRIKILVDLLLKG
jgi:hypothetical protein